MIQLKTIQHRLQKSQSIRLNTDLLLAEKMSIIEMKYMSLLAFHDDFEFMDEVKKIRTKLETLPAISRL